MPQPRPKQQRYLLDNNFLTEETLSRLKYLAVDLGVWNSLRGYNFCTYRNLTRFSGLEEFIIVDHDINPLHEVWRIQPYQFELVGLKGRDKVELEGA